MMPIKDRNLNTGTQLVARYHKQSYSCEVIGGEGGKLRYRIADGREFKSLSGAGMAITSKACNGWTFWSVETATAAHALQLTTNYLLEPQEIVEAAKITLDKGGQPDETSAPTQTPVPTTEGPGPGKKRIFRLPNQKGVPVGKTRWYCHDCGKSFLADPSEIPQYCPQGHKSV